MSDKFQIRESTRYPFQVPVEIRWTDSGLLCHFVRGISYNVSVYGLGITLPSEVPFNRELTVIVNGVKVCGEADLRHSRPCEAGFKIGLYFRLTLLMQNIPGLDALLARSYSPGSKGYQPVAPALATRFAARLWRVLTRKATPALHEAEAVGSTAAPITQ